MKVAIVGTGYVGLVSGTCFADKGHRVTCVDVDDAKIRDLTAGDIPIFEPGLSELVLRNRDAGRLDFTTDYHSALADADCVFVAVGTPQGEQGADLSGIWAVTESLATHLEEQTVVVIKSTVPVGTNRKVAEKLGELTGRTVEVASNPEFLKEGVAIDDFMKPDRVVVGVTDQRAADVLHELYKPFLDGSTVPFLVMELESAEMTKYVANCLLATKISFINEMAGICELVGADVNEVRRGIGHDQRIGFSFLAPGAGYGGSCFPKDVQALIKIAESNEYEPQILKAVNDVNDRQKRVLFEKIKTHFGGELTGRIVAIWGLAFKPNTDDIREAPALVLIESLLQAGAICQVYDPVAIENVRAVFGDRIIYVDHHYEALEEADALAILTEWAEFRNPDLNCLAQKMKHKVIFDGRNLLDCEQLRAAGFVYAGIGLNPLAAATNPQPEGQVEV